MRDRPLSTAPVLVARSGDESPATDDALERRRLQRHRFAARDRAALILESIGDAVLSTDLAGNVTYMNPAAETMTGWSHDAATGQSLAEVFHLVDARTRARAQDPMQLAVSLNKTVGLAPSCVLVRRDGKEFEIEDSAAPVRDRDGHVTGAVIVFRDVGAALETSRQMSHLAQHDALTGLPNRLLLTDRLTDAIVFAHRRRKALAVLFMDIDEFKAINDAYGHPIGDQVLQSIAAALPRALRQSDTVSRYGGDEFVIVLSEIEDAAHGAVVAAKLLQVAAGPHTPIADLTMTASVGVALYPDHGQDAVTLVVNADTAMYEAKRAGHGQCRVSTAMTPAESPPAR
jgi:diguanylate cyclase (GGDEF)-like protein/PAS domain S-box-containing protein